MIQHAPNLMTSIRKLLGVIKPCFTTCWCCQVSKHTFYQHMLIHTAMCCRLLLSTAIPSCSMCMTNRLATYNTYAFARTFKIACPVQDYLQSVYNRLTDSKSRRNMPNHPVLSLGSWCGLCLVCAVTNSWRWHNPLTIVGNLSGC